MATSSSLPAPDAQPYTPPGAPSHATEEAPHDAGMPPLTMPSPAASTPEPAPEPAPDVETDYSQPVAYDQNGRPLYAHPPAQAPAAQPAATIVTKPQAASAEVEPPPTPTPESKAVEGKDATEKHQQSIVKYPSLNLSNGEYVVSVIPRDAAGLLQIWAAAIVFFLAIGVFVGTFLYGQPVTPYVRTVAAVGLGILGLLDVVGASMFSRIYQANIVYVTNESIIQVSQSSLMASREQTVSLSNVENVSFTKGGYLASLFDYGTVDVSTRGEDANYHFTHVAAPKKQADIINNTMEAYVNARGKED